MNYYKVTVTRGHTGMGEHAAYLTFYIVADNIFHASKIALRMNGVKHHGRIPISAEKISEAEYLEGRKTSAYYRNEVSLCKRYLDS